MSGSCALKERSFQKMPGFVVVAEDSGLAMITWINEKADTRKDLLNRNDVPGIFRNRVNGKEVDLAGQVWSRAVAGTASAVHV